MLLIQVILKGKNHINVFCHIHRKIVDVKPKKSEEGI